MEIIGKLFEKRDAVKRSETFTVREFVIEVENPNSQYKDYVLFQVTNDRCSLLDQYNVGEELHVVFDIRGRRWVRPADQQVMYFNTLSAWRVERYNPSAYMSSGYQQQPMQGGMQQPMYAGVQPQPMAAPAQSQPVQSQPMQTPNIPETTDDLPF